MQPKTVQLNTVDVVRCCLGIAGGKSSRCDIHHENWLRINYAGSSFLEAIPNTNWTVVIKPVEIRTLVTLTPNSVKAKLLSIWTRLIKKSNDVTLKRPLGLSSVWTRVRLIHWRNRLQLTVTMAAQNIGDMKKKNTRLEKKISQAVIRRSGRWSLGADKGSDHEQL